MENGELSSLKVGDKLYCVECLERRVENLERIDRRIIRRSYIWYVVEYTVVWIGESLVICKVGSSTMCEPILALEAVRMHRSKEEAEKRAEHNNELIPMRERATCCEGQKLEEDQYQYGINYRIHRDRYVPAKD